MSAGMPRAAMSSNVSSDSRSSDDPRVSAALEEYMARRASGEAIVREEWLAEHAGIREVLAKCLDGLELVLAAGQGARAIWDESIAFAGFRPATQLGDFRILREVGRGGMGIVYEAEQVSLGRRVALKVLPPSSSLDPRWRQRFQVEAQAAANLRHDHIVPVFAVGIDRGIDYYAMPYIAGRTLGEVIDELRARAGLDGQEHFRWVAKLGVQAAEALGHAHGLGIIHRDVKPSNFMVDERGELWLTDFGLASFRDDDRLTRTGDLLGTLRYMSPEQAQARRAAVDHRTDVYSLGATLYELATLHPAFTGCDRHELLNRITLDEPVAPRRLNPSIPRDLETIVLKAMSKEVSDRYPTAHDLAGDLHRFLEDRSINARPPSSIDRAAKFTRRHRVALLSGVTVLILTLGVGSGLLWLEQRRTHRALDGVRDALARERQSTKVIFAMANASAASVMGTMSTCGKPGTADAHVFYVAAIRAFEQIAGMYESNPEMRQAAAEAYWRVGLARQILRDRDRVAGFENADVVTPYVKALNLMRAEVAAHPKFGDAIRLLAAIELDYGTMRINESGIEAAIPHYDHALKAFRSLATSDPANRAATQELDFHRGGVIFILNQFGRYDESTKLFRDAIELAPGASNRNNLAWHFALRYGDKPDRCAEALALAETAVAEDAGTAAYWNTLALAHLRAGDQQSAYAAIEKAMALHKPDASDYAVKGLLQASIPDLTGARAALEKARGFDIVTDLDVQHLLREAGAAVGNPQRAIP